MAGVMSGEYCEPQCASHYYWLMFLWVPLVIAFHYCGLPQLTAYIAGKHSNYSQLSVDIQSKIQIRSVFVIHRMLALLFWGVSYIPYYRSMFDYFEPIGVWDIFVKLGIVCLITPYIDDLFWNGAYLFKCNRIEFTHHCVGLIIALSIFNNQFSFYLPRCSCILCGVVASGWGAANLATIYYYCGNNATMKLVLYCVGLFFVVLETLFYIVYCTAFILRYASQESIPMIIGYICAEIVFVPAQSIVLYRFCNVIFIKLWPAAFQYKALSTVAFTK